MGELAALLSAFTWAGSNAMMGSQLGRIPAVVVSAVRLTGATLVLWLVSLALLLAGRVSGVGLGPLLALAGSAVLGPAIGDTLYYAGMRHIGLSRASPVSMATFPLFTFILAALLLGESITFGVVGGAVLIVAGLILVAGRSRSTPVGDDDRRWWGLGLVLLAALLWAFATVWLRVASEGVTPALAGAVRLSVAGLVTIIAAGVTGERMQPARYGRRGLLVLLAAGVFGTGMGSLLYVISIQEAGAARAAILSSTSPLFALPLAALVLHERLTRRVVLGALISVAGIWLVTL